MSAASPYREEAVRQAEASSHGRGIVIGACALFSAAICVQLGLFGGSFEVMMASVGLSVLGGTVVGTTWGSDDGGQRVFIGLLGAFFSHKRAGSFERMGFGDQQLHHNLGCDD